MYSVAVYGSSNSSLVFNHSTGRYGTLEEAFRHKNACANVLIKEGYVEVGRGGGDSGDITYKYERKGDVKIIGIWEN